ncbi:MAG: hypothetical protein IKD77_02400 [Bacilli bacterium]|nr:hypothetical protein [Bacilli bacterium]MBR3363206.1 hypothetical protein [Bacilli bacterium]
MNTQEYYSGLLYVIVPSKILAIFKKDIKDKITDDKHISKLVLFQRQQKPVIIYESTLHGAYEICNKDNNFYKPNTIKHYYDATEINKYSIDEDDKQKCFYNVFEGDKILLSDYLFGYKNKNNIVNKILFFKDFRSYKNMELKPNKSKKLIKAKSFYTLPELETINDELSSHILEPLECIKTYRIS